ncbi:MAG: peptidoglycan-binding protein [Candidatus Pacebacteria bacterium]|nr:peptidoglycan-binding protein [Candidatus Paceibacterota bacterium]
MSIANSNVIAKIAAVVAGLGLVAMSFAYAAPAAKADTTSDLQAQITALMAQIAALQAQAGGSASAGTAVQFNMDLTIGSTGADVTALQQWLVSKGFLQMPANTSYGYFGAVTKAAVAAWQASAGISPAAGYFGPISRAKANAAAGTTGGTTGGTTTTGDLKGGDGKFDNISSLGDIDSTVDEGDTANVVGVSFDAQDSDLSIQRADVTFTVPNSGSSLLSRYITKASLVLDGKTLATMNASDASKDGRVFTMRFSGLNGVIRDGDTGNLYVKVSAVSSIDSGDTGNITVALPVDSIRAVNGAGVSDTYISSAIDETFSVSAASTGSLSLTEASSNPDDSLVKADDNNTTDDVTLLAFNLKAKNQDVTITDLPVGFVVSGAADVNDVIQTVKLMKGDTVLKSKTISGSGNVAYLTFDNIDEMIDQDSTETYKVVATIKEFSTDFEAGDTVYASTTGADAAWDVADANGENVTTSSSVVGGTVTFTGAGITATLSGTPTSSKTVGTLANDADKMEGSISFKVAAGDDDIYLDATLVQGTTTVNAVTSGFGWATTTTSNTGTSTGYSASLSASDTNSGDSAGAYFKIPAGSSRTFTFVTSIPTGRDGGTLGVRVTGFNYGITSGAMTSVYNVGLDSFKTANVTGLDIH